MVTQKEITSGKIQDPEHGNIDIDSSIEAKLRQKPKKAKKEKTGKDILEEMKTKEAQENRITSKDLEIRIFKDAKEYQAFKDAGGHCHSWCGFGVETLVLKR